MKKGVSPLVAAVLLIAVTMTIAGILAMWASTFVRESLEPESPIRECTFANFRIYTCRYSSANSSLTVILENTGNVLLKNITTYVIYDDDTISSQAGFQNLAGGQIQAYTVLNINSNYRELTVKTHCPDVTQTDDCR